MLRRWAFQGSWFGVCVCVCSQPTPACEKPSPAQQLLTLPRLSGLTGVHGVWDGLSSMGTGDNHRRAAPREGRKGRDCCGCSSLAQHCHMGPCRALLGLGKSGKEEHCLGPATVPRKPQVQPCGLCPRFLLNGACVVCSSSVSSPGHVRG